MRITVLMLTLAGTCTACMEKPSVSQVNAQIAEPNPEWLDCRRDDDCVASFGPCGEWIAVNRTFIQQEQAWAIREGRALSCETNRNPEPETACHNQVCAILR